MTRTLGRTEFTAFCDVLGITPDLDLSPAEREAVVPPWLSSELIATTAARDKVRAWCARTPQPWSARDPAQALVDLHFVGDEILAHLVARLLAEKLPPAVTDYVVQNVTLIAAGLRISGFCGPRVPFADRPWVIVVSYTPQPDDDEGAAALARFKDVVAHECAHAWTLPEPSPGTVCASTIWMDAVHLLPLEQVAAIDPAAVAAVVEQRQDAARCEQLAKRLTKSWGFGDVG